MKLSDIVQKNTADIMAKYFDSIEVIDTKKSLYTIKISSSNMPTLGTREITFDGTTQRLLDAMYSIKDDFSDDNYVYDQIDAGQKDVYKLLDEAKATRSFINGICEDLKAQVEKESAVINVLWLSTEEMDDYQIEMLELEQEPDIQRIPSAFGERIEPEIIDLISGWADIVCGVLPWHLLSEMYEICRKENVPLLVCRTCRQSIGEDAEFTGWQQVIKASYNSVEWKGIETATYFS